MLILLNCILAAGGSLSSILLSSIPSMQVWAVDCVGLVSTTRTHPRKF